MWIPQISFETHKAWLHPCIVHLIGDYIQQKDKHTYSTGGYSIYLRFYVSWVSKQIESACFPPITENAAGDSDALWFFFFSVFL